MHNSGACPGFAKNQQLRGDMRRLQQETSCAALFLFTPFSCCSQTRVLASLLSRTKHQSSSVAAWSFLLLSERKKGKKSFPFIRPDRAPNSDLCERLLRYFLYSSLNRENLPAVNSLQPAFPQNLFFCAVNMFLANILLPFMTPGLDLG